MLRTEIVDGVSTITARGELDRADQADLREKLEYLLRDGGKSQIKLDFADVDFMDSTCGRLLSDAVAALRKSRQKLRVKLSPQVQRTLEFLSRAGLPSARTTLEDVRTQGLALA